MGKYVKQVFPGKCLGLILCHGKSRVTQCRYITSIHDYHLFVCVCIYGSFYIFPILLSMNCHSDYNTIDGRIARNRRPYHRYFSKVPKISQSA